MLAIFRLSSRHFSCATSSSLYMTGSELGLDWARRHPTDVRGIALMEFLPPQPTWIDLDARPYEFLQTMRNPDIGRRLIIDENAFVEQGRHGRRFWLTHCSISKTRVATTLREQGITIRCQGLNDEQVREAATLYAAGNSLAKIGARFDVSHTTVAAALRQQGIQLRPRPGWR